MFKGKLPVSKLPPAKLATAPPPAPAAPPTLAAHCVSLPVAAAPHATHQAVTNAASFVEMCDAAALVRARCRSPLPGRLGGGHGVCYCGQQDGDGLPHGHGLLLLADACFYFGAFSHGQRHGLGVAVFADTSAADGGSVGGGGAGLPSLSNIGHAIYHTPQPHVVAQMGCETAAGRALQQLKQLRVMLDELAACSSRHVSALPSVKTVTLCRSTYAGSWADDVCRPPSHTMLL
jgi:hypothetical protein